jgi:hypothetical protein
MIAFLAFSDGPNGFSLADKRAFRSAIACLLIISSETVCVVLTYFDNGDGDAKLSVRLPDKRAIDPDKIVLFLIH